MMTKRQINALDKRIEAIFYARCSGVIIPIMKIPAIFAEGRRAAAEGRDLETAVVDFTLALAADLAVKP